MLHERGHGPPPPLQAGEEIVAHGHGNADRAGLKIEAPDESAAFLGWAGFETLAKGGWGAVFDQIGQLGEEFLRGGAGALVVRMVFAFDENFLELIE
jgi:hypothetical protein